MFVDAAPFKYVVHFKLSHYHDFSKLSEYSTWITNVSVNINVIRLLMNIFLWWTSYTRFTLIFSFESIPADMLKIHTFCIYSFQPQFVRIAYKHQSMFWTFWIYFKCKHHARWKHLFQKYVAWFIAFNYACVASLQCQRVYRTILNYSHK